MKKLKAFDEDTGEETEFYVSVDGKIFREKFRAAKWDFIVIARGIEDHNPSFALMAENALDMILSSAILRSRLFKAVDNFRRDMNE